VTATAAGLPRRAVPRPSPGRRRARRRNLISALLFLSPWIIGFLALTAWPIIYSAYLSLTDYDVINNPNFVGTANYVQLAEDPKIALALSNTLWFTLMEVPAHVIVSLLLALLLSKAGRASGFFRTIFFLPKMTPAVAVGVLFLLMFNGQNGLINGALGLIGIEGPAWTSDPAWVKPGLALMSLWNVGSAVIILLAALQNVPRDLTEAATLDGANGFKRLLHVTIPMISPALFFITIISTIDSIQTFTEAYTAFGGAGRTAYGNDGALFYVVYLFQQGFEFLHMGFASAMAWVLFLIIMIITGIQLLVSRRFVYYEGGN
jgi:multiple sugar transport system permease protein